MPSSVMPPHDDLDEDLPGPRERTGRSQRLLIIMLGVGCVALAVSNVVLATRVSQMRRAGTLERPPAARPAVADHAAVAARAAAGDGATREPPAPAASIPSPPVRPVPGAPAPAERPRITAPAPAVELPPRPEPRQARAPRADAKGAPGPPAREHATAAWMVQAHGRAAAAERARAAADFYDPESPERAYWRRVLREIVMVGE
jgi:hypothetical protein